MSGGSTRWPVPGITWHSRWVPGCCWRWLAGPACAGDDLRQLEEVLGADADAAAGFAAELLAHPHPAVHAAAAVWGGNGSAADARIASWRAGLPPQVEHRPGARPAGTGRLGQAADLGA